MFQTIKKSMVDMIPKNCSVCSKPLFYINRYCKVCSGDFCIDDSKLLKRFEINNKVIYICDSCLKIISEVKL